MKRLLYTRRAEKDLRKISPPERRRLKLALEKLAEGRIAYFSLSGNWSGFFKLRVGDYRVIFEKRASGETLIIHYIRHRCEVYAQI